MYRHRTLRTKYYLNKRDKKILGVCAGLADYFGWNPLWVRVAAVLLTIFTPFAAVTVPGYIIIGLVASAKPRDLYDLPEEEESFWRSARVSPSLTIRNSRSGFRDLDRRLADIEAYMTSPGRSLSAEIERLR